MAWLYGPSAAGEHVKDPPGGVVRGRAQEVTGSAVEDLEDQHRASAERVLADRPDGRGTGVAREDHRVGESRRPPEWLVEPQGHLLVAPEPEPPDRRPPARRQCGPEPRPASLEHTQRHRHDYVRAFFGGTVRAAHGHTTRRVRDLGHLDAQAQVNAGRHRLHQAAVTPYGGVAEVAPSVFHLVPHPAQRLALGEVGRLGLDQRVQRLARSPGRTRRQAGPGHEGFDPIGGRRIRPEFGEQPVSRLREIFQLQAEALPDLSGRQPSSLAGVKAGQLRQRVRAAGADADLIREGAHRVPDGRVYPRPAQIDRRARQVNRVQPAADPVAGLHHDTLNPGVGKSVRDRQTGDPRPDHDHPLDRPRRPGGHVGPPVVETLSSQPGHPPIGEMPHAIPGAPAAAVRQKNP